MKLTVASPCKESWDKMKGDERVRFCGGCQKKVFNLTHLSEREVGVLLGPGRELPCVRFFQRSDGTVMTSDCPAGRRRRWLGRLAGAAGALLLGLGAMVFAASDQSPVAYPEWFEKILSLLRPAPPGQYVVQGEPAMVNPPSPAGRSGSTSQP
jgi:hypothetical protein